MADRSEDRKGSETSENKKGMGNFSPALGLIFGVPIGAALGIILQQNIGVFAGIGAGIGLVAGAAIQSILMKKS